MTVNNTVNSPAPVVLSSKAPVKQPETGVGVLGMAAMAGSAPIGLMLARYGRGRLIAGKREEDLSETASGLVTKRTKKS